MEMFKLIVDGIDLTEDDRKRIERGIEKAMVEALAGKGKGMHMHPIIQPQHREPVKFRQPEFRQITDGMPNGGILITPALEAELPQLMSQEFGGEAELAPAHEGIEFAKGFDASQIAEQNIENLAEQERLGDSGIRGQ